MDLDKKHLVIIKFIFLLIMLTILILSGDHPHGFQYEFWYVKILATNEDKMLEKIKEVFADVLGAPPEEITIDTNIDNLLEWDSLRHLELVTNLETKFNIKFKMNEIINLNSVSSIIKTIEGKEKSWTKWT